MQDELAKDRCPGAYVYGGYDQVWLWVRVSDASKVKGCGWRSVMAEKDENENWAKLCQEAATEIDPSLAGGT
jgi:hypothetical protein